MVRLGSMGITYGFSNEGPLHFRSRCTGLAKDIDVVNGCRADNLLPHEPKPEEVDDSRHYSVLS